ncbi:MAG: cytochrome P450 [Acidobacteriota bacterium]
MSAKIPHPPEKLLLGNVLDLGPSTQVQDMMKLAEQYGDIFSLQIGGRRLIVVSSFELVDELCDESRFDKRVWAPLQNVRGFAGDGLFTAHTFEPNWKKAHNILMPHFGQAAMKGYHPMMLDIALQLVERGNRLNPSDEIDVADTMTRLTLDTIGLCGFDYRFNSFQRERMHPFIRAMTSAMSIALDRSIRPEIASRLLFRQNKRFRRGVEKMNHTVDGIIQERRASGEDLSARGDLLSAMLIGKDPETGEALDDVNIRYQIITFLIAGHETTSGLLSFAAYYLQKNPEMLDRARAEVDAVLGRDFRQLPTYRQTLELRYIKQILNEALRLWPTAPMFALFPKEGDTTLGGRYEISKRDGLAVLVPMLHRDQRIWGDDADEFNPDRFAPELEQERPVNAFKPFGNGQRACIGRQFAMHEAALALGLILQRFEIFPADENYELEIKETLTLKPDGLRMKVRPREPVEDAQAPVTATETAVPATPTPIGDAKGVALTVLYGSNMGTSEGVAQRVASDAGQLGFDVTLKELDQAVGSLSSEGVTLIVCSSYNGTAPDNARNFLSWLQSDDPPDLSGVRYSIFGCGHRDWAATYQAVPKQIDQLMRERGAQRIFERGEGDGGEDFDGDFEFWYQLFWPTVAKELDLAIDDEAATGTADYDVEVIAESHPNPFVAQFGARPMTVTENRELQTPLAGRSTRHIELALPSGVRYQTGDHLGVIARNDAALVRRVLDRFAFEETARIRLNHPAPDAVHLPVGQPVRVVTLLSEYVELQAVATRAQIKKLLEHTGCPHTSGQLEELCGDDEPAQERYRERVLAQRLSLLDLLERHHACELPFGAFLTMLGPLRPRYYSISSSPQQFERILSITVAVVEGQALSGQGTYLGTCSNYLAQIGKGESVHAFVRSNDSGFGPPKNLATPLLMVGPGTGLAPFRGFLQERQAEMAKGRRAGDALLFFGCRHPDHDFLYRQELEQFRDQGVCDLVVAFSRFDEHKVYVQDRLLEHQDRVWELIEAGAAIYVCGDAGEMAPEVRATLVEICAAKTGRSEAESEQYIAEMEATGRYLTDVWAS